MIYNPPLFGYINTEEGWHLADRIIPAFTVTEDVETATAAHRYITRCGKLSTYSPEPAMHGNPIVECQACKNAT